MNIEKMYRMINFTLLGCLKTYTVHTFDKIFEFFNVYQIIVKSNELFIGDFQNVTQLIQWQRMIKCWTQKYLQQKK